MLFVARASAGDIVAIENSLRRHTTACRPHKVLHAERRARFPLLRGGKQLLRRSRQLKHGLKAVRCSSTVGRTGACCSSTKCMDAVQARLAHYAQGLYFIYTLRVNILMFCAGTSVTQMRETIQAKHVRELLLHRHQSLVVIICFAAHSC